VGRRLSFIFYSVVFVSDVLLTCMSHALTTEGEEIMGLLLGDIEVRESITLMSKR
jgi:BRCA1/BRCA2-containing complex subunit 3